MVQNLNCSRKKILLLDVDDVVCKSTFLPRMNKFLNTNYTIDDFKGYYIDECVPEDRKDEFYDLISSQNLYADCELFEGVKEVLPKLNEVYDIHICSSCIIYHAPEKSGNIFKHKFDFLMGEFPFLDPCKFIFTQAKTIICGDVIIDDNARYFQNNSAIKLLFDSYHNRNVTDEELKKLGAKRVYSWKEIEKILIP